MEAHIAEFPFSPEKFVQDLATCMLVFTLAMGLHAGEMSYAEFRTAMDNMEPDPKEAYQTIKTVIMTGWGSLGTG